MKQVVIVCERTDPDGRVFRTAHTLAHSPVVTSKGVAGWDGPPTLRLQAVRIGS
jgi:hypothetical protein